MFNEPITVTCEGFQEAWITVAKKLMGSHWELCNLMVQIKNPDLIDDRIQDNITAFAENEGLLTPKHVAYTIFPHGLYGNSGNAPKLFEAYNRKNGMYDRLHRRKPDWGTYFRRMTHYDKQGNVVNQVGNIIDAINHRGTVSRAAYTIYNCNTKSGR